jgi:hypothetical protein
VSTHLYPDDFEPSLTHSAAVSDSLDDMIRNSSARNGAAHPASDGVKNNWFLRIAQVLDLINYGPHKPGEAIPSGWVCASNRFVGSEYGKKAMNKAAAVRGTSKSS